MAPQGIHTPHFLPAVILERIGHLDHILKSMHLADECANSRFGALRSDMNGLLHQSSQTSMLLEYSEMKKPDAELHLNLSFTDVEEKVGYGLSCMPAGRLRVCHTT